jgi:hypothetical protein
MRSLFDTMLKDVKLGVSDFSKNIRSKEYINSIIEAERFLSVDDSGFTSAIILNNIMYGIIRTGYSLEDLIEDKNLLVLLSNMKYYRDEIKNGVFYEKLKEITGSVERSMLSLDLSVPEDLESSTQSICSDIPVFINNTELMLLSKGIQSKDLTCKLSPVITRFRAIQEFRAYLEVQSNGVHLALLMDTKDTSNANVSFRTPVIGIKNGAEVKALFTQNKSSGLDLSSAIEMANSIDDKPSQSTGIVAVNVETQHIVSFMKDISSRAQISLILLTNYISNNLFTVALTDESALFTGGSDTSENQLVPTGIYVPKDVTFDDIGFDKLGIDPMFNWIETLLKNNVNTDIMNLITVINNDKSKNNNHLTLEIVEGKCSVVDKEITSQWGVNNRLLSFSMLDYGTKAYLDSKKETVARFNKAVMLQCLMQDDCKRNSSILSKQLSEHIKEMGSQSVVDRIIDYTSKRNDRYTLYRNKGKKLSGLTRGINNIYESDLAYVSTTHGELACDHVGDESFKQKCFLGKNNIVDYLRFDIKTIEKFDALFDLGEEDPVSNYLARVRLGLLELDKNKDKYRTAPNELSSYPDDGRIIEECLLNPWGKKKIVILVPVTKKQLELFYEKAILSR